MSLRRIFREVQSRSLWQVLGVYMLGCWAVLQVVDVLAGNLGLPSWAFPLTLVLLLVGLVIVLAIALVQEKRAARDDATADAATGVRPARRWLTWRNATVGGVGVLALSGVIAAGWHFVGAPAAAADSAVMRSIAVLPFATRSEDQQDRYFAEGMHDDLLAQLAKIDSLTVISRTSVMQYADTRKNIRQIGDELGVAAVLEGSIQRAGENVRVNVQLIDVDSDRHIWAETYDEELTAANVFAIQSDLARRIVEELRVTLSPAVAKRIDTRPTESLEAYDFYIRGRYAFQHRGILGEDLDETRALFEQAIARDSNFTAAWVGLAHLELASVNWLKVPAAVGIPRASALVERALALDPDNAEALGNLARIQTARNEPQKAERTLLRALELNPGSAGLHIAYSGILPDLGRSQEAIAVAQRAIQLDPLNVAPRYALSFAYFYASEFDRAVSEVEKAIQMAPADWYAYYTLGWAHAGATRTGLAIDALRKALEHTDDNASIVRVAMAFTFAHGGQPDSARAYLEEVDVLETGYDYALVLYELGERDRAFVALETSFRNDPESVRRVEFDPLAADLRADSRYAPLRGRLGL